MRLKSGMEQAVYILLLLARTPSRSTLTGEALSERIGASPSYLKKGIRQLVRAGIVRSIPGTRGGFSLAQSPERITMLDVYRAVEGEGSLYQECGIYTRVMECGELETDTGCLLADLMERAEAAWTGVLAEETLASMVEKAERSYPPERLAAIDRWIQSQIEREE